MIRAYDGLHDNALRLTNVDFDDIIGLRKLMDEHDLYDEPMATMYDDDTVIVLVKSDRIITNTHQDNGWIRVMVYWYDGTVEELYSID